MKKFLLIALGCAALSNGVKAQSFTTQKDTASIDYVLGSGSTDLDNLIANTAGAPIKITWKAISNNLPSDWWGGSNQPNSANQNNAIGVCDNKNCYSGATALNPSTTWISNDYAAGVTNGMFHLTLDLGTSSTTGTYYITVNLMNGSTSKNVTFAIRALNPTAVSNVNKSSNDVQLYPNPAHNSVNVVFDPNAGVKFISVYNLIGKPVSTFRVTGGSAQLDISDIPAGVYFVRLMDAQSHVLDTRKFTRQ